MSKKDNLKAVSVKLPPGLHKQVLARAKATGMKVHAVYADLVGKGLRA